MEWWKNGIMGKCHLYIKIDPLSQTQYSSIPLFHYSIARDGGKAGDH
jgi:hypothetical protein